jgi:ADP-ribosylglycohydrolase
MAISLLDRFRGCLLGQAVGDALGAPFETMPAEAIYYGFGFAKEIIAAPPVDRLEYTDDTQMMIGVAENLADHGRIGRSQPHWPDSSAIPIPIRMQWGRPSGSVAMWTQLPR